LPTAGKATREPAGEASTKLDGEAKKLERAFGVKDGWTY
jgi:hypothetical protein